MAVLVTGGAGYIGSHTAAVLHEAGRDRKMGRELMLIQTAHTFR